MSLYTADLVDIPLEVFGGYCPAIPPPVLPTGAASVAQDVMFPQAALRSRGGLLNFFAASPTQPPGNASINGLKSYITPTLQQRLIVWDSLSNLYKESPQGTLNLLFSRPGYPGLFYQSTSLFGREYQAFFNAAGGFDIPRQYDDTFWDRVSQVGPGVSPSVADWGQSFTIAAAGVPGVKMYQNGQLILAISEVGFVCTATIAGAIGAGSGFIVGDKILVAGVATAGYNGTFVVSAIVRSGVNFLVSYVNTVSGLPADATGTVSSQLVEVTTTTANTFALGQTVTIAGVATGGYNGSWVIRAILSGTQFLVEIASFGLANDGGGTVGDFGSIVAGLHQISVSFITRQGFITPASVPPNSWTAGGNKRANVTAIPTGPPNIVARLLLFTPVITAPATTGSFYSLPTGSPQLPNTSAMLIPDNVTTQAVVDFTDTILIAGFQANYLFTQLELGECACMLGYNSRLVGLGERNHISNVINLTFDGGFTGTLPNGWTGGDARTPGGNSALAAGLPADWGDAYVITGDGATANRGYISQPFYQDYLKVPIIARATAYGVRARIRSVNAPASGLLVIQLNSGNGGFTTVGLQVNVAALTNNFQEFTANLTDTPIASVPTDLILQLYASSTLSNGGQIIVDSVEVYPLMAPFNYSTGRFSHAFNPESFDSVTGAIQVRPTDGQQLRAGFPLRNNLYLAKDHYLCYVVDDGVNEPASWAVNEVSATIGICGPNAVDWTEEWATFAERAGLHVCWGSDPVKVTPEFQVDATHTGKVAWSSINWAAAWTLWVRIDRVNKMILVGAPINGATTPNVVFMLDYQWLENAQDIASSPMVTYSQFTGKILAHGRGRRWAVWSMVANSMTFAERTDGTAQPFFGNGSANGKIYQQLDAATQPSDDGAAVPWSYQTYAMPTHQEEQMLQLGAHRKRFGYMKWRVIGAGLLNLAVTTAQRSTLLRSYAMALSPTADSERGMNIAGERFFLSIRTNAVAGTWFQMEKWIGCMKKDAAFVVRGGNQ